MKIDLNLEEIARKLIQIYYQEILLLELFERVRITPELLREEMQRLHRLRNNTFQVLAKAALANKWDQRPLG